MADYTAIAEVGETLLRLFRKGMNPEPIPDEKHIGVASPVDNGDFKLTIYLYDIAVSGENLQHSMIRRGQRMMQYPPLPVNLYYLITAHSPSGMNSSGMQSPGIEEQRILGKVIQMVHDHRTVQGSWLVGSLQDSQEEFRIGIHPVPMETKIQLFSKESYKCSIAIEVGPIFLDSTRMEKSSLVKEGDFTLQER